MQYKEYDKKPISIRDYFEDAKERGVTLVVKGNNGKKVLLVQHPSRPNYCILVNKDGTMNTNNPDGVYMGEPFMAWKLLGEIDFSTELD